MYRENKIADFVIDKINEHIVSYHNSELFSLNPTLCDLNSKLNELSIDSLDRVELIIEIENNFQIDIKDEDAEKWIYVKDIVDYIKEKENQDKNECHITF